MYHNYQICIKIITFRVIFLSRCTFPEMFFSIKYFIDDVYSNVREIFDPSTLLKMILNFVLFLSLIYEALKGKFSVFFMWML